MILSKQVLFDLSMNNLRQTKQIHQLADTANEIMVFTSNTEPRFCLLVSYLA